MNDTMRKPEADTDISLLVGGLMVIVFGVFAVMLSIGIGWVGAALLGVVLLVLAWKVPSARVLRFLILGFAAAAVLGAMYDLFT